MTLFEVPATMNETQFRKALVNGFIRCGFETNHNQSTKAGNRWITSGSPGFPDILAAGPLGICVVETKGFKTAVEATQIVWLERFAQGGAHAWLLRPNSVDWYTLAKWVENPQLAPFRYGWTHAQYLTALASVEANRLHRRKS